MLSCARTVLRFTSTRALLVVVGFLFWATALADTRQHQVLLLMSYHHGYSWEDRILQGFEGWSWQDRPVFWVEWLDTKRRPGGPHRERMQEMLREKYADFHFDLIVAVDDNALEIAVNESIFDGVPIVFGGINQDPALIVGERPGVTGVAERFELARTLHLALTLHEGIRHLLFVTADDESGAGMRDTIQQALALHLKDPGIAVEHWILRNLEGTETLLAQLGPGTLVFALGSIPLVEGGRSLEVEELVAHVRANTAQPLYTDLDAAIGYGALGGYLNSGFETGRLMGNMAERILQGEDADHIAVVFEAPVALLFDYAELERFDIPIRALPRGSEVINKPPSIFDRSNRRWLLTFSGVVGLLLIVTVTLGVRNRIQASRQAALYRQATHDELTGLPNRVWLMDQFAAKFSREDWDSDDRRANRVALVMLDLNRFKLINDTYGHSFGDDLVAAVAQRIRACLRSGESLVRFSGDAFIILSPIIDDVDLEVLGDRCRYMLSDPFHLNGCRIQVSAAFGVSVADIGGQEIERMLREADTAMHEAKREGSGKLLFFDDSIHERALREHQIESRLPLAIEQGLIEVHFQPIVHAGTGQVVGFETLARWRDESLGQVPPIEFVRIATESGLIGSLTLAILRKACKAFRPFLQCSPRPYLAVNVSVSDVYGESFSSRLMEILEEEGIPPRSLVLEVTEDMLLGDFCMVTAALSRLNEHGIRIAIDDFGTGYSSMSYLSSYMVNTIKIDQSFVRSIVSKDSDQKIVRAIVSMANDLELSVVTEGVETAEQIALLRALGCILLQGYAYGRPRPPEEWALELGCDTAMKPLVPN